MHEDSAQVPLPGKFMGGLTVSEAIGLQGEARAFADDDDLRLDTDRFADEPRRFHLQAPSRTAIITLWAVGLIAALAIAAYIQTSQQRTAAAAMDASPPPAEAPPAAATPLNPVEPALPTAPPIVSDARLAPVTRPPPQAERPSPAAQSSAGRPAADVNPAKAPASPKVVKEDAAAAPHKAPADKKSDKKPNVARLKVQLNHAYNQAVKAGVPRDTLKARRAEWAILYAQAQRKSPAAVAALYKTRTAQLEALAQRQPPPERTN